jgi:hypothetical protein
MGAGLLTVKFRYIIVQGAHIFVIKIILIDIVSLWYCLCVVDLECVVTHVITSLLTLSIHATLTLY